MNCQEVQDNLIEDLDCRLDEEISIHLKCCSECRFLDEDLLALGELARSLGNQCQVPSDFGSKVLEQAAKSNAAGPWGLKPICAALFLAMLAVGFLWIKDGAGGFAEEVGGGSVVSFREQEDNVEPSYVEVVVEDPLVGNVILRLPSVIEIHRTDLHEDSNRKNVSY